MVAKARQRCGAAGTFALAAMLCACSKSSISEPSTQPSIGAPVLTYQAVDLGTLGGTFSAAADINVQDQVVGPSATADGVNHAFLWQSGVMTDLGTLGGDSSAAAEIDDNGQVAGWSTNAAGEMRALLWSAGVMQDLGGAARLLRIRVNRRGQVFWTAAMASDLAHRRAFLWSDGVLQELGTLGDTGYAEARRLP